MIVSFLLLCIVFILWECFRKESLKTKGENRFSFENPIQTPLSCVFHTFNWYQSPVLISNLTVYQYRSGVCEKLMSSPPGNKDNVIVSNLPLVMVRSLIAGRTD